jgi:hypothetical protein
LWLFAHKVCLAMCLLTLATQRQLTDTSALFVAVIMDETTSDPMESVRSTAQEGVSGSTAPREHMFLEFSVQMEE